MTTFLSFSFNYFIHSRHIITMLQFYSEIFFNTITNWSFHLFGPISFHSQSISTPIISIQFIQLIQSIQSSNPSLIQSPSTRSLSTAHSRSAAQAFRHYILEAKEIRSPIKAIGETQFFHIRVENILIVAITKANVNAALVFEVLIDTWMMEFSFSLFSSFFIAVVLDHRCVQRILQQSGWRIDSQQLCVDLWNSWWDFGLWIPTELLQGSSPGTHHSGQGKDHW